MLALARLVGGAAPDGGLAILQPELRTFEGI